MWAFLGFLAFCSLLSPLDGIAQGNPPGVLVVVSPGAFSKYVSKIFLRNRLIQTYILAIQFPPGSPPPGKELGPWIQGLHVVKVYLPIISMDLKPNSTAQLHLKVRLHLSAQYHLFERVDLIVDAHFMAAVRFQNYSVGILRLKSEMCETQVTIAQVISPSYLVKAQVRPMVLDILTGSLPRALCQAVEIVGNMALFDFLYTANVLLPIRSATTLQYRLATLPQTSPTVFAVQLNILIRNARRFLTIPASDHSIAFPSLNSNALCHVFTQDALNSILSVMIQIAPQEFITTPQVFSGSTQLIDAVAILLSHQKLFQCLKCPQKSPLKILLRVVEEAAIILQPTNPHFQLALEISVAAKDPLGAITDLFVLKANLRLNIEISVHDNRLIFFTTLSRVKLLVISSDIGHVSVSSISKWIHLLLVEIFMPRFNDCLDGGIPMPSLLNIKVDYPAFLVLQGSLALCI